ncbi:MAG: bifunctional metallophosphatase/5'-nucleotidase [Ignavibacteria bacterium]|jgi:2',3'-cyclic-nucleotide 2'-phosphodiesterase/3'-nucleotidase
MKRILYLFLIAFLFSTSALIFSQEVRLKFIQTSDIHGAVFPYDFINDKETNYSLANLQTYIRKERENTDREVILLDGGDILQGQPTVYYYNYEKPNIPHLYAEVMNYMDYDAATVGNHDIEPGHEVYDRFTNELQMPWLAANAVNVSTGEPYFEPYVVIEKKGVKIAVLGLITPGIPKWLNEKIWEGIDFEDMVESAEKWVPIIRENENPDLLIGLFHAGVDYTYGNESADTYRNENASQLVAEQVPGFDIIFVGHDHQGWNFKVKNPDDEEVLILGTQAHGRTATAAEVNLKFNEETQSWEKNISGEIIEADNYVVDEDFMNRFHASYETIKEYVSRPIGKFISPVSSKDAFFGNSAFVDFIHNVQLELSNADISFTAPLTFNTIIKEGDLYVRDMFKLYKYENTLYTMELSGWEIKDYLEYSYSLWFNTMQNEDDHLLKFELDENGDIVYGRGHPQLLNQYYGFDCAAGIDYTVDVSKPDGEKIKIISLSNGEHFRFDNNYLVALNSYRGNGGGGHLTNGISLNKEEIKNRIKSVSGKDLRFYIMKWIEKQGTISPQANGNWTVIPEQWWLKGKEKDYKILFGN